MAIALVIHATSASFDGTGVTTGGIDTTGANLIVLSVSYNNTPTISDSKSNTWTPLTEKVNSVKARIWYCINPTVGASHTFTATGTGCAPAIAVMAFSSAAGGFDVENGGSASVSSTVATGSVTPGQNNELIYASVAGNGTTIPSSIDSSVTLLDTSAGTANAFSIGSAYQIQTTATARNPTFTMSAATTSLAAVIATFRQGSTAVAGRMFQVF